LPVLADAVLDQRLGAIEEDLVYFMVAGEGDDGADGDARAGPCAAAGS
jgi:hypothetical protein